MSIDYAVEIVRNAITVGLMVALPLLATALLVGVTVSLIQAITQIQEQTLTFVPKILIMGAVFIIALPWILSRLIAFLVGSFGSLGALVS